MTQPSGPTVRPEGRLDSKIALVGEAPGADEARIGKPFQGQSGKLLNQLLQKAGISRADCYLDNVFPHRPPNNYIEPWLNLKKSRPEETAYYLESREQLVERLRQCDANVVVALGNVPIWALLGKKSVTKMRGSVLWCPEIEKKVLCCFHPASALEFRNYLNQRLIVHDLVRAKRESTDPMLFETPCDFIIRPSFEEARTFLENILKFKLACGTDIEVYNRAVSCISFCPTPSDEMETNKYWMGMDDFQWRSISIPFVRSGNDDFYTLDEEMELMRLVAQIYEDPSIKKVFQNGMFDMTFMLEKHGIKTVNFDDTMVAQALLYPDYKKGLDFITSMWTNHPYYKDEGKQWGRLVWDEDDFWTYSAKDSLICAEAIESQLSELERMDNLEAYHRTIKLMTPLMCIQHKGIRVDMDALEQAKKDIDTEIDKLQLQLNEEAGEEINASSPKQLAALFYVKLGYPTYTKNKRVTTDVTAMKRLSRQGCKAASLVLKLRGRKKMKGTYFEMSFDADKRFRGSINPVGASTGRVSSSKTIFGTGGNMQNQPPEMNKFFIADPGKAIATIDLSQAENRIVAYLANESYMIQAFEEGLDVHSLTANLIFGVDVEVIVAMHKEWEDSNGEAGCCQVGDGSYSFRYWGKKANHGLNYGLGYRKFGILNELPDGESKRVVEGYHSAYPGVRNVFHRNVENELREHNRTLQNLYGRKRMFLDKWGPDLFQAAYGFKPQSTVADKIWVDGINYLYYDYLPGYEREYRDEVDILNTRHDSLDVQFPIGRDLGAACDLLQHLKARLEAPLQYKDRTFSIPADIKVGPSLGGQAKLKEISPEGIKDAYERAKRG